MAAAYEWQEVEDRTLKLYRQLHDKVSAKSIARNKVRLHSVPCHYLPPRV